MWSSFQAVVRDYSNPVITPFATNIVNGFNANNYRAGLAYQVNPKNKVMLGFTRGKPGAPINLTIPIGPEFHANFYAVGLSHQADKFRFDITVEYSDLLRATKTAQPLPGPVAGHMNRVLFNVSVPV